MINKKISLPLFSCKLQNSNVTVICKHNIFSYFLCQLLGGNSTVDLETLQTSISILSISVHVTIFLHKYLDMVLISFSDKNTYILYVKYRLSILLTALSKLQWLWGNWWEFLCQIAQVAPCPKLIQPLHVLHFKNTYSLSYIGLDLKANTF